MNPIIIPPVLDPPNPKDAEEFSPWLKNVVNKFMFKYVKNGGTFSDALPDLYAGKDLLFIRKMQMKSI